jgi:hypothetical protein
MIHVSELKCREVLLPKSELEMGIGDEERQMYDSVFKGKC